MSAPLRSNGGLGRPLVLALALVGCSARAALDQHLAETERALRDVEVRGALRCAPRELAVARSHLEFA
ncbi:MAG TPA: hypothetical protein VNN80_25830, partial [Polyangiaceae bacterium]|nr:hypothetical protein [Polyangiaceae bacterium]